MAREKYMDKIAVNLKGMCGENELRHKDFELVTVFYNKAGQFCQLCEDAEINNVYVVRHTITGETKEIGSECVKNRFHISNSVVNKAYRLLLEARKEEDNEEYIRTTYAAELSFLEKALKEDPKNKFFRSCWRNLTEYKEDLWPERATILHKMMAGEEETGLPASGLSPEQEERRLSQAGKLEEVLKAKTLDEKDRAFVESLLAQAKEGVLSGKQAFWADKLYEVHVEQATMDLEKEIAEQNAKLDAILAANISGKDKTFVESLRSQGATKLLSPKQTYWVNRLHKEYVTSLEIAN